MQHRIPTAYRLQANGVLEEANRNFKNILSMMKKNSIDWPKQYHLLCGGTGQHEIVLRSNTILFYLQNGGGATCGNKNSIIASHPGR